MKMKQLRLCLWGLLLALALALPAQAALEIQRESVPLVADYQLFTSEDQNTIAVQGTITVRNTEAENLSVQTAVSGLPSGYSAGVVGNITVLAGNSSDILFTINIPHQEGSGEQPIGTITISSGSLTDSAALIQNTSTMLTIDEIEVSYTDDDDDSRDDKIDRADELTLRRDVKAATEMTFSVKIENRFNDNYDNDDSMLENIVLTVEADDSDLFPKGFQEEYDFEDLDAEKDSEIDLQFSLPEDLDEGDYTITFIIEGEDGIGAEHRDEKEIHFTVTRLKDDVRIEKTIITPAPVSLCNPQAAVEVQLWNLGTDDQRRAAVAVFNEQLGINELRQDILIDEFDHKNDRRTETFTLNLAKELAAGQYPLDITVFVNDDERTDTERIFLELAACEEGAASEENETEEEEEAAEEGLPVLTAEEAAGNLQENLSANRISSAAVVETTENPFTAGDVILIVMIAAVVLLLGLITILVMVLFK